MDFSVLPPEVNSGRMYAGPGAGPMLAAATAWARLAAELGSAGRASESVITELTGAAWLGPAAEAMAAAVAPYAGWLNAVAAQAEQTAARVAAAAGAFDEAFAAVVPPPVIAANRSQWATLVSTNVFGQNSAAIAAADAQYAQMWVQDVVAMHGYAARAAAAASVPPFSPPPPVANPAGSAGQAAAIGNAVAGNTHDQLAQLLAAIPQALHPTASPAGSTAPLADSLGSAQATPTPSLSQLASYVGAVARTILPANDANISALYGMGQYARNINITLDQAAAGGGKAGTAPAPRAEADMPTGVPTSARLPGADRPEPLVAAGLGNADAVGKLAVPPAWVQATPEMQLTAAALPDTTANAVPTVAAGNSSDLFADMALAGLAGRALAGRPSRTPRASDPDGSARNQLDRVAAEFTGTDEVRYWHVGTSQRKGLLEELAQQPGVHEVSFDSDSQATTKPRPEPS